MIQLGGFAPGNPTVGWRDRTGGVDLLQRKEDSMAQLSSSDVPLETPKPASASVMAQNAAMLKALPFSDTSDFDNASRGFLGTIENARIISASGRVVWSLEPYGFLSSEVAPPTVNPSLWRQSRLNM